MNAKEALRVELAALEERVARTRQALALLDGDGAVEETVPEVPAADHVIRQSREMWAEKVLDYLKPRKGQRVPRYELQNEVGIPSGSLSHISGLLEARGVTLLRGEGKTKRVRGYLYNPAKAKPAKPVEDQPAPVEDVAGVEERLRPPSAEKHRHATPAKLATPDRSAKRPPGGTKKAVVRAVQEAGTAGISTTDVAEKVGVGLEAARYHLQGLTDAVVGVKPAGKVGQAMVWYAKGREPAAQQRETVTRPGEGSRLGRLRPTARRV